MEAGYTTKTQVQLGGVGTRLFGYESRCVPAIFGGCHQEHGKTVFPWTRVVGRYTGPQKGDGETQPCEVFPR